MHRPDAHVADTCGRTQLRTALESLSWTVNPIENDYGSDFEVEVFQAGKSTGVAFKIQLKSSREPRYSANRDFVSVAIPRENADYMCRELRVPTVLVLADIEQKETFWIVTQLDKNVLQSLRASPRQDSATFRIPVQNRLPATWENLLLAVGQAETLLSLRSLLSEPLPRFLDSIEGRVDQDQVRDDLRTKSDAIRLRQLRERLLAGSGDADREQLEKIIADQNASVEIRFWALLIAEDVEAAQASQNNATAEEQARLRLSIAHRLRTLTHRGPRHLKFYAVLQKRASELLLLTSHDWAQHINWKFHETEGDAFWRTQLAFERARLTRAVARKYNECARLAAYAAASKYLAPLAQPLVRIALGLTIFVQRLSDQGLTEPAVAYRDSAFSICRLAAAVALARGDDEVLTNAAGAAAGLAENTASKAYQWAWHASDLVSNSEMKQALRARMEAFGRQLDTGPSGYEIDIVEEQRIYTSMATALGIDLSATGDQISTAVRIGIADWDPTRILSNCQHLFVSLGSHGMVGEWLRLATIGMKFLHCTLHGHTMGGVSLDNVYAGFRESHCASCADCRPHRPDWHYSHEWQRAQNELHLKFIDRGHRM
jgi:Domain of unknown function (DUF4365)